MKHSYDKFHTEYTKDNDVGNTATKLRGDKKHHKC